MRYYVVSDTHGFYKNTMWALEKAGYFTDSHPHKLIICGDLMDRGPGAIQFQEFAAKLIQNDELILVRGNHEDLMVDMIEGYNRYMYEIFVCQSHHISNGTFGTACDLTGFGRTQAFVSKDEFVDAVRQTDFYKTIIPKSIDYFETEHYIFVHGWIPCPDNTYLPSWRDATTRQWGDARWKNGMEMAHRFGIKEPGKTIVCGHWHTSFAHHKYEKKCTEFGKGAKFNPYYEDGLIAIDGCTAYSGIVNCIVIDD